MTDVSFRIIQLQMGYRIKLLRNGVGISQETLALNANVISWSRPSLGLLSQVVY
jgi:hypothetical protein